MARKVSEALDQARTLLQDTVVPYRTPDSELLHYLNNSFAEMRRERPDLFVGRFTMQLPVYDETETDETYPLDDMYFPASVHYMVAMTELRSDQNTDDGRAAAFLQLFVSQLGTRS